MQSLPTEKPKLFSLEFFSTKATTEEEQEIANKERMVCYKHGDMLELQDFEYLMLLLRKHIRSWWD